MWIIIIIIIIIIINIDINNSNNIYFLLLFLFIINEITVETSCYFRAELVSLAAVFCLVTQHSSPTKEEERCVTRQKWCKSLLYCITTVATERLGLIPGVAFNSVK